MLADFAMAHDTDGKLYITGGGIRSLQFASFPATHTRLALAVGLELDEDEKNDPHQVRIESQGPGPGPIVKPQELTLRVPTDAKPPYYLNFVYNMDRLVFPTEGDFGFTVAIDGVVTTAVPLRVNAARGAAALTVQAGALLMEAYEAFGLGDTSLATRLLREVTERFPNEPNGWNNLGFVLLAVNDPIGARRALLRAVDLGYTRLEIADANLGCAEYASGNPITALTLFERCINERGFSPNAILYAISQSNLYPVEVRSASEYAALMTLDAAWSALRSEDTSKATQFLEIARAAQLGVRDDEGGRRYALSVQSLADELKH